MTRPLIGHFHTQLIIKLMSGLTQRLTLFIVLLCLMALLPRLLPGDAFQLMFGENLDAMSQQEIDTIRESLGFERTSLWRSVSSDVLSILSGDLGRSRPHASAVSDLLRNTLPWTTLLVAASCPVFLTIGVLSAIEAGRRPGQIVDVTLTTFMTILVSVPPFASASLLLIAFAIAWPIFPTSGAEPLIRSDDGFERIQAIAYHAALPVLALSLHEVGRYFFVLRGEVMSLSQKPYVQAAIGRGVHGWAERKDLYVRNLVPAILSRLSYSIPMLFGAALFIEVIFSYPGIGRLMYQAVLDRDHALLQGVTATMAALVLGLNWAFDAASDVIAARG